MKPLFDLLARLDRVQRSRRFKLVTSGVVLLLAAGLFTGLAVKRFAPGTDEEIVQRSNERQESLAKTGRQSQTFAEHASRVYDLLLLGIKPLQGRPQDPGAAAPKTPIAGAVTVALVFAVVAGAVIAVAWLGLLLTYLGLFALGWGIGWPLAALFPALGAGQLLVAATPLAIAFLTGMELLRVVFSGPSPVLAVAQNVLSEAVRMKISLVFIVIILLLLSYVPGALDATQPLRYRVQQWLQYGIGLSYVVLTLLTVFLATGSVAFEQRDKVIWQTMTKPVQPWQYLLGKWVGVMGLNLVLLAVIAGGVYAFTEYLRLQPAHGEMAYQVREDGRVTLGQPDQMTEDRRILETQVLTARIGRMIEPANLFESRQTDLIVDANLKRKMEDDQSVRDTPAARAEIREQVLRAFRDALTNAVEAQVEDLLKADPTIIDSPRLRLQVENQVLSSWEGLYRSIAPGGRQVYFVLDLPHTGENEKPVPLTMKFKINAGSNDPSQIYRLLFVLNGVQFERQVALKSAQTFTFPSSLVLPDGSLEVLVASAADNPREVSFPPDGIEVLYSTSSYAANFLRVMLGVWVKLAFIASVSIAAATFLSFPVACLVALSVLFAAESAGFLRTALEYYTSKTTEGIDWFAVGVRAIAVPVERIFRVYASLKPTEKLVDGRLISWGAILESIAVVGGWALAMLGLGWAIFRQRELATYSGK